MNGVESHDVFSMLALKGLKMMSFSLQWRESGVKLSEDVLRWSQRGQTDMVFGKYAEAEMAVMRNSG